MKKRNIFWAVILIFIAVYLVAEQNAYDTCDSVL